MTNSDEIFGTPVAGYLSNHAFFDGIYINTDSLGDCRVDRVIPIMEEVQIFLCRQMRATVNRLAEKHKGGLKVLDVGTGSGVLGIYADRILNIENEYSTLSEIAALDCSQRALDFAELNCEINKTKSFKILEKQRYSEDSVADNSQDIILINPPFNPTFPGWNDVIALHASAGDIGMDSFDEWIEIIPKHLCPNGIIIGCQMTPVCDGEVLAMRKLRDTLGCKSTVSYCRMMVGGDCVTREFLERQYQDHLENYPSQQEEELRKWIERVSVDYPNLALVYFEARIVGGTGEIKEDVEPLWIAHGKTWEDRIEVHRMIVNNTNNNSVFSLFQKGSGFFSQKKQQQNHESIQSIYNSEELVVENICEFISKRSPNDLFDFICVDAFQIVHGTGVLYEQLASHHIAWISPESIRTSSFPKRVMKARQSISQFGQTSGLGYFLHPAYTGALSTIGQSIYLATTIQTQVNIEDKDLSFKPYLDFAKAHFNSRSKKNKIKPINIIKNKHDFFYTSNSLSDFDVPTYGKFYDKFESDNRCFHPGLRKLRDDNNVSIQELINQAMDSPDFAFELDMVMLEDLRSSHKALHLLAFKELNKLWKNKLKWSSYIGIPLWLVNKDKRQSGIDKLPDTYIGSVWILVGSTRSERPTLKHEEFLNEMMKFLWPLLADDFRWEVTKILGDLKVATINNIIAHELRTIASALKGEWIPPVKKWISTNNKNPLFNITEVPDDSLDDGTIAIIKVRKSWSDKLLIAPYGPFLDLAIDYIKLWCMRPTFKDLPLDKKPANLIDAINECWKISCKVSMIYYYKRIHVANLQKLIEIDEDFISDLEIFELMIDINCHLRQDSSELLLYWQNADEVKISMTKIRILFALFTNCCKHFDPYHIINISILKTASGEISIDINNKKKNSREIKTIHNKLVDKALKLEKWSFEYIQRRLDIIENSFDNSEKDTDFGTSIILQSLVNSISGKYDYENKPHEYITKLAFISTFS